jgi:hypothetical protein
VIVRRGEAIAPPLDAERMLIADWFSPEDAIHGDIRPEDVSW